MYRLNDPKPSLVKIIAAVYLTALATVFACTSDTPQDTPNSETGPGASTLDLECADLVEQPNIGETPLGPPPGMPYIFTGTAYVDGEPAPAGGDEGLNAFDRL